MAKNNRIKPVSDFRDFLKKNPLPFSILPESNEAFKAAMVTLENQLLSLEHDKLIANKAHQVTQKDIIQKHIAQLEQIKTTFKSNRNVLENDIKSLERQYKEKQQRLAHDHKAYLMKNKEDTKELNTTTNRLIYNHLIHKNQSEDRARYVKDQESHSYKLHIDDFNDVRDQKNKEYLDLFDAFTKKIATEIEALKRESEMHHKGYLITQKEQLKNNENQVKLTKTTFNKKTIKLNQDISSLNKHHQAIHAALDVQNTTEISTFESQKESKEALHAKTLRNILNVFKEALADADHRLDQIKDEHHQERDKTQKHYSAEITMLHNRIQKYKEVFNEDNQGILQEMKLATEMAKAQNSKTFKYAEIRHTAMRKTHELTKKTNKNIKILNKQIYQKKHEMNAALYQVDIHYASLVHELKAKKQIAEILKNRDSYVIRAILKKDLETIDDHIERVKFLTNISHEIQRLTQAKDVIPFEIELNEAFLEKEAQLNILAVQEDLYNLEYYKQSESLNLALLTDIERKEFSLEERRLKHEVQIKRVEIQNLLAIEKHKLLLQYTHIEQDIVIELARAQYNLDEAQRFFDKSIALERLSLEKEIHQFEHQVNATLLEKEKTLAIEKKLTEIALEKLKLSHKISVEKAKKVLTLAEFDREVQQQILQHSYDTLTHCYSYIETAIIRFLEAFDHQKNQENALPGWLHGIQTFLHQLEGLIKAIIQELLQNEKSFFEKKIEDLTGIKYNTLRESLLERFEQQQAAFDNEKERVDQRIAVLQEGNIEIQNTILSIDQDISIAYGAIANIRQEASERLIDARERPLFSRLRAYKQIRLFKKQIIPIKGNIKKWHQIIDGYEDEMARNDKRIAKIKLEYRRIEDEREVAKKDYADKVAMLSNEQHAEAKSYYANLERTENRYKRAFVELNQGLMIFEATFSLLSHSEMHGNDGFIETQKSSINANLSTLAKSILSNSSEAKEDADKLLRTLVQDHEKVISQYNQELFLETENLNQHYKALMVSTEKDIKKLHKHHKTNKNIFTNSSKEAVRTLKRSHHDKYKSLTHVKHQIESRLNQTLEDKRTNLRALEDNLTAVSHNLETTLNQTLKELKRKSDETITKHQNKIIRLAEEYLNKKEETETKIANYLNQKQEKQKDLVLKTKEKAFDHEANIKKLRQQENLYLQRFKARVQARDIAQKTHEASQDKSCDKAILLIQKNASTRIKKDTKPIRKMMKQKAKQIKK